MYHCVVFTDILFLCALIYQAGFAKFYYSDHKFSRNKDRLETSIVGNFVASYMENEK